MAHTYTELKEKTVAELREIAAGMKEEAVQGYTQMNKEHLLKALCTALHIDMHAHHVATGLEKTAVKRRIKELKAQRDQLVAAHDSAQLRVVRRQIHRLKRELRKHAV